MGETSFDEAGILAEAREETGLHDLGSGWLPGLRMLLRTYDENPFHEGGRARNRRQLVRLLATRLRVEAAFRRHPEIRQRELGSPLVLTGFPRSGTSALFNLLAVHRDARALLNWETQYPDPLEGLPPDAPDPRRDALEAGYARGRARSPEFVKIHFASADTPEECVLLQALALHGMQRGIEALLEPYASWYRSQDLSGMYAYYADLLRMLDWRRPGKRWLLKSPVHMDGIGELFSVLPEVRIVWSHRDPAVGVASICSMTHLLMSGQMEVDPTELGPRVMDFYARCLERGLAARERCDPDRFVDVAYDDLVRDPLEVARRIHDRFGMPLDAESLEAMRAHVEAHPKDRHGRHEYRLEDHGITHEQVRERFGDYARRFGIEISAPRRPE